MTEPTQHADAVRVYLVWNDADYYGPDLWSVHLSQEAAEAWIDQYLADPKTLYDETERRHFSVEAVEPGENLRGY